MQIIQKSRQGIDYLITTLKEKPLTLTKAWFWKIPHRSGKEDIHLKVGRYKKRLFGEELETPTPKSELTLDSDEFETLCKFISENYQPFKDGTKQYIAVDDSFGTESVENLKALFDNPDKEQLLSFIIQKNILPKDLMASLQYQEKLKSVEDFETMLAENLTEHDWQKWFTKNHWVLGSEFVKVIDGRSIDTRNISDYLMQAYDGFLDIIEIKRPEGDLTFWASQQDHGNYVPSMSLSKAISQATKYLYELERESNSQKFYERIGDIKTIKPRCVLIFGRSFDWDNDQKEAYRILNASYHNLTILSYDHVLSRAKRILGLGEAVPVSPSLEVEIGSIPF